MNESSSLEPKGGCIAAATAILGQKWTALILRDLADEPCRFCDFERSIPGLNPRTLSKRLDDLESQEVIARVDDSQRYQLTDKGRDLLPVLRAMADWGEKYAPALDTNSAQ